MGALFLIDQEGFIQNYEMYVPCLCRKFGLFDIFWLCKL